MPPPASGNIDFSKDIQPILAKNCYACHGPDKQKADLRLDQRSRALKGSENGPVIVPGKSAESRLFKLVGGLDPDTVMPPKDARLTTNQVALIAQWIDAGAPWPDDPNDVDPKDHWAFQPPRRPAVPEIRNPKSEIRNPVDAFIAAAREAKALTPSLEASRNVLGRRLSLDVLGLPPTPAEVEAFVTDASPGAYSNVVERLLASPHYGERWGRHWLDLARWAETEGYEGNTFRSSVWRYRDYVIRSFNDDKPYDRFLLEQIAGDELEPYSDENLIATGFLSSARYSHNEEDKAKQRNDVLVDTANATAAVTLGLTMNCAQCHDHKFDPITHRDYYRWQGFFVRGQLVYGLLRDGRLWREFEAGAPPELDAARKLRDALHLKAEAVFAPEKLEKLTPEARRVRNLPNELLAQGDRGKPGRLRKEVEEALEEDDRKLYVELMRRLDKLEFARAEQQPQMWAFYSPASSPHTIEMLPPRGDYPLPFRPEELKAAQPVVLKRGESSLRGNEVGIGWPEVFGSTPPDLAGQKPRTELVKWLTRTNNPLTARVWVNYVWQQHFGRGLVTTSADFGTQGEKPSHPELLDWLAMELIQSGWSTKHLHRLILNSSTYRQASRPDSRNETIDPENRYLWRWTPRRLEAEAIRDAALFVSGELDPRLGGPSVTTNRFDTDFRRTLYLRQIRDEFPKAQRMFDGPTANESCARRYVSTVPLQPLYLLNNPFWLRRAEALAARVEKLSGDRDRAMDAAFGICLSRKPTPKDHELAAAFFVKAGSDNKPRETFVHFCQVLLNANDFVYLE